MSPDSRWRSAAPLSYWLDDTVQPAPRADFPRRSHVDLVVIGGGVANSGPVLFDPLGQALRDYAALDFIRGLRVLPAQLGGDAGLVGAAALLRVP